jgi:hypothetical protein
MQDLPIIQKTYDLIKWYVLELTHCTFSIAARTSASILALGVAPILATLTAAALRNSASAC